MLGIFYIFIFLFGLIIGSFLNCVVYRLEKKQGFVKGRSFCPQCSHILKWYDLLPVLSFILLKARCRYCGKKISWQYPMVEIATGALLILNFKFSLLRQGSRLRLSGFGGQVGGQVIFNFQTIGRLIYFWAISACLVVIFVYDLKTFLIPDKVVYPAIGAAFLYRLSCSIAAGSYGLFLGALLSALAASGFFFLIWFISRGKWLGFGDVKLAFLMGIFLGWPNILPALFFAFLIGAIIGLALIALKRKKIKSEVPFGPFLAAGAFIALFWGEQIINWYLNLL